MSFSIGRLAPVALVLLLSACDGGSGNDGPRPNPAPTPTPTPPPIATLNVTLTPATQDITITEDDTGQMLGFGAALAGSTTDPVVADLQYDRAQVALEGELTRENGGYTVRLRPLASLPLGTYSGSATFRLCREAACTTVYPGSTQTFSYRFTTRMGDWTTFQRNAAHNGFVRAAFNPAVFAKAWEYVPPSSTRVSTAASSNDLAYVTSRGSDGTTTLRALTATTGAERWSYNLGGVSYWSPPAVGNGRVFVTTMVSSSSENQIIAVDAASGQFKGPSALFASQWSDFLQPTPYGEGLYMSAGYFGNVLYGFNYADLSFWTYEAEGGRIWDGETPAVDADNVYYYSGPNMEVVDRKTGEMKRRMPDPFFQNSFYDYYGAPILGSSANVLAYSSQRGSTTPSILVNWSLSTGAYAWRSADVYSTTPAVGAGVVYLARNDPGRLDALSEASGAVQWSWTPPVGERFVGNTILTNTLVFVSTDKAVYALPLQGNHAPVWSAPTGGEMAITSEGMLIVTKQGTTGYYPNTLVAYRLR